MENDMRLPISREAAQQLVAERKAALEAAKAVDAAPGNHIRGAMHVRQAKEALDMAEQLLAETKET